ncbi:RrF2 family transcriptional regulator [Corynebacterium sp. H78]|uniref:RrF2 family transcriptional regulator n=1 Tax=Corynebacterium sp. H78 TaxID=3133417 RepID=UPI003097A8C1
MQLTVFSDLGLRIIMRMAVAEPGRKFTAADVADELNASRAHVSKVVTRLAELGFVTALKGRYGGIYFAEGAEKKSVGHLLRILEAGEIVDCVGTACPLINGCKLRVALAGAQEAFFSYLDPITIEQLTHTPALRGHFSLPITPVE